MGKQKRARQKYHLSCAKERVRANKQVDQTSSPKEENNLPLSFQPSESIFAGLDIDVACLKKSLVDDDGRSVKSIAKSIKSSSGRLLRKEAKRKLRHHLFIEKIDNIYSEINANKRKQKNKNYTEINENNLKVEYLLNKNSVKVKKIPIRSSKQNGIKKAKQRKEIMLKDIGVFKRILSDPNFIEKPLEHIKATIQDKVVSEII